MGKNQHLVLKDIEICASTLQPNSNMSQGKHVTALTNPTFHQTTTKTTKLTACVIFLKLQILCLKMYVCENYKLTAWRKTTEYMYVNSGKNSYLNNTGTLVACLITLSASVLHLQ